MERMTGVSRSGRSMIVTARSQTTTMTPIMMATSALLRVLNIVPGTRDCPTPPRACHAGSFLFWPPGFSHKNRCRFVISVAMHLLAIARAITTTRQLGHDPLRRYAGCLMRPKIPIVGLFL